LTDVNMLDRLAAWRAAVANACLGAVFAIVLAAEAYNLADTHRTWWLDCVVSLIVCMAALLRERSLITAAVAGLAVSLAAALAAALLRLPGQPSIAATLALLVLLASVVRASPVLPAAAIAAGGVALVGTNMGLHPDLGFGLGLWWGVAMAAGLLLRLLDSRRQASLDAVRRAERLELARELHDVAAHHMTGVVLQAQAARIAARKHPDMLDGALADIESAGVGALESMRRVIGLLRDRNDATTLTPGSGSGSGPGPGQLAELLQRFERGGPAVRLCLPDSSAGPPWPPEVATTVHRIVAEALANVRRHAPLAEEVSVTVAHDQRGVTVEITDDAPAGGTRRFPGTGGYGLTGMRERVEALGGTLSAGPCPGRGWSVRATVPFVDRS
jgi:signal transduction histidine kinase